MESIKEFTDEDAANVNGYVYTHSTTYRTNTQQTEATCNSRGRCAAKVTDNQDDTVEEQLDFGRVQSSEARRYDDGEGLESSAVQTARTL